MGKTSRPLKILVALSLVDMPWIDAFRDKGHEVTVASPVIGACLGDYDLVLGPQCARFVPGMEKYLDSMIKGARAVKFGKKAE